MHVVIVGGGIVGTAVAARLAGEGRDHAVTLLERSALGAETTAASAGMVLRASTDPTPLDAGLRGHARKRYDALREAGDLDADPVGALYVAEGDAYAEKLEAAAASLRERGVRASYRSADGLTDLGVAAGVGRGGLYVPDDLAFEPTEIVDVLAARARARGADLRTGVEVTDVRVRDGRVVGVETDDGRIDADYVVNAAGPWAPDLNERVGVSLPLCHTLGPMVELEADRPVEAPFTILESRRYVRPVGERGAYVGEFLTEYVEGQRYDPPDLRLPPAFRQAVDEVDGIVPALAGATPVDEWAGLRTVTPDGWPIVGETATPGYLVACGPTGLGITLAPVLADVVAATIEAREPPEIVAEAGRRLAPDRF
ncbi:NAD(P)/FAD-dependent oxidoreductase [Salinilacihabitans rarus]|uniref:NAD(P)/FAD-dependent oxidoreductase n=1 Tax=Salinilacihabitans rarus TaxID=2961596 RepID=UPI0020C92DB5|nr:FAD-binding oxidoreductase [Salinilacihabitans rarus]